MCRQVADYSRRCWIVFFLLFGNSVEKIPEGYKRDFVNGLRETLGIIGAPIRFSMRAGNENPYAPKKRRGRREVLSVMAGLVPAIHETSRVSCCLGDRTLSGGWHKDVDGRDAPTAVRFKFRSGRVGVGVSRVAGEAAVFGALSGLFGA
jgi:hypothetical protein